MPDVEPLVLALDLGTGRLKAGLVGLDGSVDAWAISSYPSHVAGDRGEQDPNDWWAALVAAVGQLGSSTSRVAAVAVVGQGPTCVATDERGAATRPAITWLDRRAVDEASILAAAAGVAPWLLGILPAALWIERHEPEIAASTAHYLSAWEWLAMRLSGVPAATRSAGQVTVEPTILDRVGLPSTKIPPTVASGTPIGELTVAAAAELGLAPGVPVIAGLNDAYASCLGAGLLDPGDAIDTGGRSGGIAVYTADEPTVPGAWIAPAPIEGRWLVGGAMAATGQSLDWLMEEVFGGDRPLEGLLDEAALVPPGSDGLVFLPYLAGERSPIWDPAARGAFVGLTLAHRQAHLVRSVLEASAFADRHVLEPILAAGLPVRELRVCGGNARSRLWNQIKADVLGIPVAVPAVPDTAMLGAAILGAVGIGAASDLAAGMRSMVRMAEVIEPDGAVRARYDEAFGVYRSLYPALAEAMHVLGGQADRG